MCKRTQWRLGGQGNPVQCDTQLWILEQKEYIGGKTGDIQIHTRI